MFSKPVPFSDEYAKINRAIHGTIGMVFIVLGILMVAVGIYFDMTSKSADFSTYLIMSFLCFLLGVTFKIRGAQFAENEAIYKAIQELREERK